ncbi:putative Rossmann-fold nucleotide-binding protein [Nocardioides albertanoniae]|uniref:Putative Rossmann-fold nucleotide-binding protein n=1 Tax=Nocardioides albertanoniae TaxID=1175486 RepID=A0A543AA26_9ACTN|nr:Rossmann fold nucleotide-binding protein [Nocardioides albertanoniae]TQL69360.1 putative Rossmann-fold nucleotide-binding protein [Nocardioides albertanoniae]
MKRHRGRHVDIESADELDEHLAAGAGSLRGWRLRAVDLTSRSATLRKAELAGATFLGCRFAPGDGDYVEDEGALVMPVIPEAPVDVYRSDLYTADELYDDPIYARSLDARAYAWLQQPLDADDELAIALHDHAIDAALEQWVGAQREAGQRIVGVMGGHALQRGEEAYAQAARLAQHLAGHHVVATGGGPGAMEAANLGAYLAQAPAAVLESALEQLATVPTFRPSIRAWAQVALGVREGFEGQPERSLGIPTWHYGHEPPNVFAGAIAKYFRNATREAVLLEVCDGGIVFLPGAGGTVQEVFQDACENYYADASAVAPMVLVGRRYWTEELPVWPLLQALARGREMEPHVHLVDSADEVLEVIGAGVPG